MRQFQQQQHRTAANSPGTAVKPGILNYTKMQLIYALSSHHQCTTVYVPRANMVQAQSHTSRQ
jgi:hypothetical protein